MNIEKYFKIWKQLVSCAAGSYLSNRLESGGYFLGKMVRFGFFLLLIVSIFNYTNTMAGYSKYEVILFFLTFNLLDVLAQAFFRGIYHFGNDVKQGNFDYNLVKPVNPLFYLMSRITDILDMILLIPIGGFIFFVVGKLPIAIGLENILSYLFFIMSGLIIVVAFHILGACVIIWSTENENTIWLYRDLMNVGRFPPEIFSPTIQNVFIFVIPVIIIVAFPAKAFLGILSWQWMVFGLLYAILFFVTSLLIWKISLKKYSSASS
ncbi:MAG: hypothetical protein Athens071425_483 [Parcubacteria group bacterium Athens0714_25]|nr:MAG: hypothetical protein Athens071425_483 [Parcubacteria group bacterium Athens0714_25]